MNPALRGPARTSQPPQSAAAEPRNTKNSVNIQPSVDTFQSQVVANSDCTKPMSAGQSTDFVIPTARDNGSQNTENPYAMPMHKCIQSAAGGTSQRLNPGPATVRSFARKSPAPPGCGIAPDTLDIVLPSRLAPLDRRHSRLCLVGVETPASLDLDP